jgi:hypothetical protein
VTVDASLTIGSSAPASTAQPNSVGADGRKSPSLACGSLLTPPTPIHRSYARTSCHSCVYNFISVGKCYVSMKSFCDSRGSLDIPPTDARLKLKAEHISPLSFLQRSRIVRNVPDDGLFKKSPR